MADSNLPMAINPNTSMMPQGFAPPQATGGGFSLTPRDIIQILRKRKWLIIFFLILFTGVSAVVTVLWQKYAPQYTTSAMIQIKPIGNANALSSSGDVVSASPYMADLLETHARFATYPAVLKRAVELDDEPESVTGVKLNIRSLEWFEKDPKTTELRLADSLRVSPIKRTSIIAVSVTASDPNTASILATAVAKAYELEQADATENLYLTHLKQLEKQREDKDQQAQASLVKMRRLADLMAPSLRNPTGTVLQQQTLLMMEFRSRLVSAEMELANIERLAASNNLKSSEAAMMILARDPAYNQMRTLQTRTAGDLKQLLDVYGENHPNVSKLKQSLANIDADIAYREEQATINIESEARGLVDELRTQVKELQESINSNSAELANIDKNESDFKIEAQTYRTIQDDIERLERSIVETKIRIDGERSVFMKNPAPVPLKMSQPKWAIMIPGGVVLGLLAGLAVTLLLELADSSIKRPSDIRDQVSLPLLGIIPHADDLEEDVEEVATVLQTHPDSPIGEAFRQVRTRLLFSGPIEEQRTLLIASPSPEDGRTVVATNLALTMAQSGSQVLLVDANFRQPKVTHLFEGCDGPGLSNALVEQSDWRDMIKEVRPNLFVLGAGPLPPNPAELLGSNHMRDLVAEMSERFDRVLFDCGPALVVTDPVALASVVDGVILTIRAGVNTSGVAQRARNTIRESGGRILGAVLNGVRAMSGGYLRKHYETFYEYRESPSLPSK